MEPAQARVNRLAALQRVSAHLDSQRDLANHVAAQYLAVAVGRAVQEPHVAANREEQATWAIGRRQTNGVRGLGFIHLAVVTEQPGLAVLGAGDAECSMCSAAGPGARSWPTEHNRENPNENFCQKLLFI